VVVTNSSSGGGAERTMNSLVNLLHNNHVDVAIFPINDGDVDAVVPVCEVISPVRNWKAGLTPTILSFFAFRSKISRINPSLVIANCELPELYSVFLPFKIKLIFVEHTSRPWRKHRILGILVRLLARLRNVNWVLVSDHLVKKRIFKNPVFIIPNLISGRENPLAEGNSAHSRIVYIGRLSHEKDPEMFLDIVKLSGRPATIIGNGILAEELTSHSLNENLPVQFLGHLNNPWGEIRRNDIVVITSQFEGDGLVLLEAISRDLPVLVRDIPDLRRFNLPDWCYFQNVAGATSRLSELSENSASLRVPPDIAERILSTRNEESISGLWVGLIERLTTP
jgi:glycosyltransferase involved in cell wall biosynthesis